MMYLMNKRDARLAEHLVTEKSDMMFAGVVAGNNPGEVWVDELATPSVALVWSQGLEAFQFYGRPDEEQSSGELAEFIETTIIPFLQEKEISFFEYSAEEEEWIPLLEEAFQGREIRSCRQYVYKAGPNKSIEGEVELAEPFQVICIDEEFITSLKDGKIKNADFLVKYIETFWGTVENYWNQGYGYAALHDDEIASFVISSFKYRSTQAIGVETLEKYRQRGLASSLTKMLLKKFYANGIEPWWDCTDTNIGSWKSAESGRLVRDHSYQVYWFRF